MIPTDAPAPLTHQQNTLVVALLGLIPKDGTPVRVTDIATSARAKHAEAVHLLFEAQRLGIASAGLTYCRESDTFFIDPELRHAHA